MQRDVPPNSLDLEPLDSDECEHGVPWDEDCELCNREDDLAE